MAEATAGNECSEIRQSLNICLRCSIGQSFPFTVPSTPEILPADRQRSIQGGAGHQDQTSAKMDKCYNTVSLLYFKIHQKAEVASLSFYFREYANNQTSGHSR